MKDHVIVCGAGATGRHIILELFTARTSVVAIDSDEDKLVWLREHHPDAVFDYVVGDATDDEVLSRAGIRDARGVVATLPSDKDNLYIVVATRQDNPSARIVARAGEVSHVDKLKRAGADRVVAMNYIGGRRMATELLRPVLMRFLDDMMKDGHGGHRLSEASIEAGSQLADMTLGAAAIRETFGMSVLAIGDGDRAWRFNPAGDERLTPGSVLIVLGTTDQVNALRTAGRKRT